jgi:hypothetical protein
LCAKNPRARTRSAAGERAGAAVGAGAAAGEPANDAAAPAPSASPAAMIDRCLIIIPLRMLPMTSYCRERAFEPGRPARRCATLNHRFLGTRCGQSSEVNE